MFEELYEFAGKYREENILKENFRFSQFEYIDENIKKILKKIDLEKLKSENFEKQIEDVSEIMTDLNVLHPFREGNGRAIREFIRELLEDMGYEINFFNIEYEEIIEASKYAVFDETKQKNLLKKYIKSKKELN
ncbi:fic family protein [Clostridium sp. CAG:921]|nr:fic family protein [Clostridium sp. CAG:921]